MCRTKIICTLGPATDSKKIIRELVKAGMSAVRINIAHDELEDHWRRIKLVRSVADIPIILDLKGPEVRTKVHKPISVKVGQRVEGGFSTSHPLSFNYDFYAEVKIGQKVFIDDGQIETVIVKKNNHKIVLKSNSNGLIKNNKGVNFPMLNLKIPPLSKRDLKALNLAKELELDFIALSFTRNKKDLARVKKKLKGHNIGVIAKIENHEGVENIDEIIENSAGVMVARGDLGVELNLEKIPIIQKEIIQKCNAVGKTAITATQMLESMIEKRLPTRAEASDVANAMLDGSDAVMLSGETAIGKHPVQVVKTISKIGKEVEPFISSPFKISKCRNISDVISKALYPIVTDFNPDKIISVTRTGYTSRMISRFKFNKDIISFSHYPRSTRKLNLVYGVKPIFWPQIPKHDRAYHVAKYLLKKNLLCKSDTFVIVAGARTNISHTSNMIEIHKVEDLLHYMRRKHSKKKK